MIIYRCTNPSCSRFKQRTEKVCPGITVQGPRFVSYCRESRSGYVPVRDLA